MKNTLYVIAFMFVCVSCAHINYTNVATQSKPLRLLLVKHYVLDGHFPDDLRTLQLLDAHFDGNGCVWKAWAYSSDGESYTIWNYPGRTRQSLVLKFNPTNSSETGWFINNDDGHFEAQRIALLPEERNILEQKKAH